MIELKESASPITLADIQGTEGRLDVKLPKGLTELLLHSNGGRPVDTLFVQGRTTYVVHWILPVKHKEPENTLELTTKGLRHVIPKRLIPFACDPFGNYFCFSTRDVDHGAVWFYDHEMHDDPMQRVRRLAGSVDEFFEKLQKDTK